MSVEEYKRIFRVNYLYIGFFMNLISFWSLIRKRDYENTKSHQ